MSSKQPNTRTRPQKHQNKTAWKAADKYKTDPNTKLIQKIVVTNCCPKCTSVIEWKIKYGKYKRLTQPAKCTRCSEKRIKSAYHILCDVCVQETPGVCAKCRANDQDIVNPPQPSREEELRLQEELQQELQHLPERKRRAFLRDLAKKEKGVTETTPSDEEEIDGQHQATAPSSKDPRDLSDVRKEALERLKSITSKYGKKLLDDDFDFDINGDIETLNLSSEEEDDEDE